VSERVTLGEEEIARALSPSIPESLSPSRLKLLFELWNAGYDRGVYLADSEVQAGKDLERYGYAEHDPSSPRHYRVTDNGRLRLEAPMLLLKTKP
jgi:hypothetical protein